MRWNWQLEDWPKFKYDPKIILKQEKEFLLDVGASTAFLKNIGEQDYKQFVVEMISDEGTESSKIEGEILDRASLQSSIKKHFGLKSSLKRINKKESGMAELMCDVYETYQTQLTHKMLHKWHSMLFKDESHIDNRGSYRTHMEPMQIVSGRYGNQKVFFEAPPSNKVYKEMSLFIDWFNTASSEYSLLGSAAIAHVYFESIHPFEDGNGRIGRALVEKILSQGIGRPTLIAISKVLEHKKKEYYSSLERCNRTLSINHWVEFFANAILQAERDSMRLLKFLIEKSKMLTTLSGLINSRQEKTLIRIFDAGLKGFQGGLSADNYIAITKASRATATRDLAELVKLGALQKTGELRHTRYWLNISS